MPDYRYRGDNECCSFTINQTMAEDRIASCPACGGKVVQVIDKIPSVRVRYALRGTGHDYREDLARFPNDPEAYVDGPTAVRKLLDKRKRQGWEVRERVENTRPEPKNLAAEAYESAKAKGFRFDHELED